MKVIDLASHRSALPGAKRLSIPVRTRQINQVMLHVEGFHKSKQIVAEAVAEGGSEGARGSTLAGLAGLPAQPEQACHLRWGSWVQLSVHEQVDPSQPFPMWQALPSDSS